MSVFIIAEAGVNHNGSLKIAKHLIDVAASAGSDAIKFQTFKAENLVTKSIQKTRYQIKNTSLGSNQYDMLKKYELDESAHRELIEHCKKRKITFLSSPFDVGSILLLKKLAIKTFKIPSGEITNLPYLRLLGSLNKKIILSTGMSNLKEIKNAIDILTVAGTKKNNIIILHANTEYPTPYSDVNLRAMITIGNTFKVKYGYSDHTEGMEVPIAAVAMGASCIEKHFTLDQNMDGPDHKASLNPVQLKQMIVSIRNIQKALGSRVKKPSKSELKNIKLVRKSIVAKTKINKGEIFNSYNLTVKRAGSGISPMKWDQLIGTRAKRDYIEDDLI